MDKENLMQADEEEKEEIIDLPIAAGNTNLPSEILDSNEFNDSNQQLAEESKSGRDLDLKNELKAVENMDTITSDKSFEFLSHIGGKKEMKKRKASVGSQYSKNSAGSRKQATPISN